MLQEVNLKGKRIHLILENYVMVYLPELKNFKGGVVRVELFDDGIGAVEYISHMGSDLSVVNAARVSFGTEKKEVDEKDVKLINYLMSHNHSSPFEHCVVTFRFTVPLFIRSQHHRHRTWAYNEISRRYTDVDMEFYQPKSFRTQHKSNRQASTENLIDPIVEYNRAGLPVSCVASSMVKAHNAESLKLLKSFWMLVFVGSRPEVCCTEPLHKVLWNS